MTKIILEFNDRKPVSYIMYDRSSIEDVEKLATLLLTHCENATFASIIKGDKVYAIMEK